MRRERIPPWIFILGSIAIVIIEVSVMSCFIPDDISAVGQVMIVFTYGAGMAVILLPYAVIYDALFYSLTRDNPRRRTSIFFHAIFGAIMGLLLIGGVMLWNPAHENNQSNFIVGFLPFICHAIIATLAYYCACRKFLITDKHSAPKPTE